MITSRAFVVRAARERLQIERHRLARGFQILFQLLRELCRITRGEQGVRTAIERTCATGATDSMHVRRHIARGVEVYDGFNRLNVESASGDIRRHEHVRVLTLKSLHRELSLRLIQVAVQGDGFYSARRELVHELFHGRLVIDEDDGLSFVDGVAEIFKQPSRAASVVFEDVHDLSHVLIRASDVTDGDSDSVSRENVASQSLHGRGHRGAKHHALPVGTNRLTNRAYDFFETHVKHSVGFVQRQVRDAT